MSSTSFLADPYFPSAFRHFPHSAVPANGPLLPSMPPKLPSLEGLLKRIHSEHSDSGASTDDESLASVTSSPVRHVHQQQQQMPSLRSILAPALLQKRSWDESSQSDAASDYMGSPKRAATTTTTVPKSAAPQRSRASKYCKIDGCERVSQRNNLCHSHGGKRLCKEDGCASKDRGNGFCIKHGGGKICSIGGCDKKARRKGLCTQHFRVCDSLSSPGYESSSDSLASTCSYA